MGGKPIQYFLSDQRSDPHVGTVISYPGFGSLSGFLEKWKSSNTTGKQMKWTALQVFEYALSIF